MKNQYSPLFAVASAALVFTAMQGFTYPLLAIRLHLAGRPDWFAGLNAAMTPLGMTLSAFIVPPLVGRLGSFRCTVTGLVGSAACLLAIGGSGGYLLWIPLRFLLGAFLMVVYVVTDTWMNQLAPEKSRGRVLGVYSAVLSIGFAVGPAALAVVGVAGWRPFLLAAACPLAAVIPLVFWRNDLPDSHEKPSSVLAFAGKAPVLLAAVAIVALVDQSSMSLLPLFAIAHRQTASAANVALVVMILGSVVLQYPVGWLGDLFPLRVVASACAVSAAAAAASLQLLSLAPAFFWSGIFLWGGAYFGIYTLSLVRLGERFSGADLVAGNAAFGVAWGVGGTVGPALAGTAMSLAGPPGLPACFVLLFFSLAMLLSAKRAHF